MLTVLNVCSPTQKELVKHLGISEDSITDEHQLIQPERGNMPRGFAILEFADEKSYQVSGAQLGTSLGALQ